MNQHFIAATLATAAMLPLVPKAAAHDVQDNRARIVLRDERHLSVSLFIAYADALRLALAPQRSPQEFLMVYSATDPARLQKELLRAQARFQAETKLYLATGKEIPLTGWVWPDAKQVQAMMQQRIMQAMVDPAGHAHDEPVEIDADTIAPENVVAVRVQFPEEFQNVLVVWYRASQLSVEPKSWSPALKF
jgi:hypothetical protein